MAQIPGTKFTELQPPTQTGQITWSPPPSTASPQAVSALRKGGNVLAAYALNVQRQEMALDYSELERKIDEAGWAARNAVVGDEEADRRLWEQFQTDAQAIAASSRYKDVNELLTQHLNKVSPNWQQGIYTSSLAKRRENSRDRFNIEGAGLLENGRIDEYKKLTEDMFKLGTISKAERDNFIEAAPIESQVLIAEKMAELGNYTLAQAEIKKIDLEKLTKEQRLRIRNLSRISNEQRDRKHDINGRNFLARLWDDDPNNQPTPQEIADAIRPENDLITESMGKYLMDNIGDTSAKETDLSKLSIVNDAILNYQINPSPVSKQQALDTIYENTRYLSKTDGKSKLNELYSDVSRIDAAERREAYSDMAQLLGGSPDPTNILAFAFGNPNEKDAWILSKILWDAEIQKAIDAKRPLDRLQKRYAAIRIARQIKQDMKDKTGEELLSLPVEKLKTKPPTEQDISAVLGLQEIWDEMSINERRTAMRALTLGKSPEEIINYFKQNK